MDAKEHNEPLVQREYYREEKGIPTLRSKILVVLQDPDFREPDGDHESEYSKMFRIWEEKALRLIAEIADLIKDECICEDGTVMGGKMMCEPDIFQGYATILNVLGGWPNEDGVRIINELLNTDN